MSDDSKEYFDANWVYAICLELYGDNRMKFYCELGHDETLSLVNDDVEMVSSIEEMDSGVNIGYPQLQREVFKSLIRVLEGRVQDKRSLFEN